MKVLVITEEKAIGYSLKEILSMEDYEASIAENWMDGLKLFGQESFEVAIVSLDSPHLTGMDFLAAIKQRNIALKVILMSRKPDDRVKESCMKMGAYGFLSIPIDLHELLILLNSARIEKKG